LARAVQSLLASTLVPEQFVIVDASNDTSALADIAALFAGGPRAIVRTATQAGAAVQRNQAMTFAEHDMILFCDDDIVCEPECIERLWLAVQADESIGGASAAIVNQSFARPGAAMRVMLAACGAPEGETYAGRIAGPAIAFLPRLQGKNIAPVQWLNLGCTLYRRALLPDPPFDSVFSGYSIGEDVTLSLRVARRARLVNVPSARILHDSQKGSHKASAVALGRMELVNRHYIMTDVMEKRGWRDVARLLLWECCQLGVSLVRERGGAVFWQQLYGRLLGAGDIVRSR
jgi:glycosyltransferase involved in cell wall biosynthesis